VTLSSSLFLSLREGVSLASGADGDLVLQGPDAKVPFKHVPPGLRAALEILTNAGARGDRLIETVLRVDGPSGLPRLYYYLHRLTQHGIVLQSAELDGKRLATLTSISRLCALADCAGARDRRYALSRFSYMHRQNGEMVLESPLSHARLTLHDWRAAALVHVLAQPCYLADICGQVPGLSDDAASQLLTMLFSAAMAQEVDDNQVLAEDAHDALQVWEFHDLLFHARSREGRHDYPVGGTYRFVGRIEPPPALRAVPASDVVELYRPDLDRLRREDPPFAHVQGMRRSFREYGNLPIGAQQLGEFLYRVGRVKEHFKQEVLTPEPVIMDFAPRPYPGGGRLYELELYIVVNACTDLEPGLYYYNALTHRLEKISGKTPEVELLLEGAAEATAIPVENLQVLLIIAARFQRVAWKYSSMAYAAILKNVGVLYQTMYLAATAMGLAPCGIGCGNSDLFHRAAGTEYYTETSVGEFLLGSKRR
jgi:SagB-type dehydrogenase family enzyme